MYKGAAQAFRAFYQGLGIGNSSSEFGPGFRVWGLGFL